MTQPQTVTPGDVLGPLNAFESKAAPRQLFLRGDASLLEHGPRIAVVGSRRASSEGLELAKRITEMLVSRLFCGNCRTVTVRSRRGGVLSVGVNINGLHGEAASPFKTSKRIPCRQRCHQGLGQFGG